MGLIHKIGGSINLLFSFFFRAEIRVQFRHVPVNIYDKNFGTKLDQSTNELVIRVQPDEAIYLKINNKVPGLGMRLDRSTLNLHYAARYNEIFDSPTLYC